MKLSCTQENLAQALALVAPIATKGGTLPILQNILLQAEESSLKISSTNLEIGVTAHVRGKIQNTGTFTINGRLFFEYINLLGQDTVSLALDNDHLEIRSGNQRTKIAGLASEEFPVIPTIENGENYSVAITEFKEAVSQVLFAASISDARPELSGILMKFKGDTLTLVGTDSYRLAERKVKLATPSKEPNTTIVPLRTMQELSRILGQSEGEVVIGVADNQILFNINDVELISRVISANYPDYSEIIPKDKKTTVVLDKDPLIRAIKSASLFCRAGLNHVNFQFSSDKILVSASSSQVGENTIEVPAKIEGADCDIVFDYRYILDGLSAINGSEIIVKLNSSSSPGVFVPKEEAKYLYLVMPIKQ